MSKIGKRLIAGMEDLLRGLKAGKPMNVVQVRREETPDGPMHLRSEWTWTAGIGWRRRAAKRK